MVSHRDHSADRKEIGSRSVAWFAPDIRRARDDIVMTTSSIKPSVRLSRRVTGIRISPTIAVMNAAQDLIGKGVDVVDFGAGEPDFPTPPSVAAAGKRAIDNGLTKYTSNAGTKALRDAIAARYQKRW